MDSFKFRQILAPAIIGQATQGTIFCGGMSHIYGNHISVWGVIISARCDIANAKSPVYYYLPVVKWEDFKRMELPDIIIENAINSEKRSLKKALSKANLSDSIIDINLDAADRETLIGSIQDKNQRKSLQKKFLHLDSLIACDKNNTEVLLELCKETINNVFTDLSDNKNASYYLIEDKETGVLVVRLRELRRISPHFMKSLGRGIQVPFIDSSTIKSEVATLDDGELYMPLYNMKSPYIEHLVQRYVYQFDRIGVDNFHSNLLTLR